MTSNIAPWAVLLLVASVVGVLARRLHVPYSVGLVVAGIGLALLPWHPSVSLSRELVYSGILPPLIFEAACQLRWDALRRKLALVVVLATVGVLLSALATGAVMTGLGHWPISAALVFGILIAATDPVSVLATLKEIGARGRLPLTIEAESLLKDGTAAVLFAIAIGLVTGDPLTYSAVAITLGATLAIGLLAGAVVAGTPLGPIGVRSCVYGPVAVGITCLAAGCAPSAPRARQVATTVSADQQAAAQEAAESAALAWFGLLDAGKYQESWSAASTLFRDHLSQSRWKAKLAHARGHLGEPASRKLLLTVFAQTIADYDSAPEGRWLAGRQGEYVIVKFSSAYLYLNVIETVIVMKDSDGVWRVADYYVASGDEASCIGSRICE